MKYQSQSVQFYAALNLSLICMKMFPGSEEKNRDSRMSGRASKEISGDRMGWKMWEKLEIKYSLKCKMSKKEIIY